MKITIALLSIATLGVLAMPVHANHSSREFNRYDRIEQRIKNQHYRIRDGIGSGELTRREANRLRKQQRYIMRLTYRFMHDGHLNRHEFSELKNELELAGKRIYRLKHNDRSRYTKRNNNRYYY